MTAHAISKQDYLPHLDGLRALAIVLVLLFHFELGGANRGFLGVDIFFVVSGYLVGGMVLRDLAGRCFRPLEFARRRVTRLIPAMVATALLTLAVGIIVLLPAELVDAAAGIRSAALFFANHHYYALLDYFSATKMQQYFLHSWSLSVEEQFYLTFPFAAWVMVRLRVPLPLLLIPGLIGSFLVAEWLRAQLPIAAFYWMPTRAWQFVLGAWVATISVASLRRFRLGSTTAVAGLLLATIPAFVPSGTTLPDDHVMRLTVTFGTALLLASNLVHPAGPLARAMAMPPARQIGRISYSLYLLHWPLLTLGAAWLITPANLLQRLMLLASSIAMAWISWRWIEVPLRRIGNAPTMPRRYVFGAAAVAVTTVVFLSTLVIRQQGFPGRLSATGHAYFAALNDVHPRRNDCVNAEGFKSIPPQRACREGAAVRPDLALWSDSHGPEFGYALGELLKQQNRSLLLLPSSACPPIIDPRFAPTSACAAHNRAVLDHVNSQPEIKTVILTSFFDGYERLSAANHLLALRETIGALRAAGKRVVMMAPYPRPNFAVARGLARQDLPGSTVKLQSLPRAQHEARRAIWLAALASISDGDTVRIFDPAAAICEAERCPYAISGAPLYFDDDHITLTAARLSAPSLVPFLNSPNENAVSTAPK